MKTFVKFVDKETLLTVDHYFFVSPVVPPVGAKILLDDGSYYFVRNVTYTFGHDNFNQGDDDMMTITIMVELC